MPLVLKAAPSTRGPVRLTDAIRLIRRGGLVVFPTESVYGLGADIRNPDAIREVIRLKRRPAAQPLLVHCSDESQLAGLVAEIPGTGRVLMREFWPGPLALIFRGAESVPAAVTGCTGTVGIRMVSHPVAGRLIAELGAPIIGTSANFHGETPPGDFAEINPDLLKQTAVAIDSGRCSPGKPSTVLDVTCDPPGLLRIGAVSRERIESALGVRLDAAR